ncbi:eisosome protein SEG2-like [Contarinia nasturtii]|uniref:eisosome protein SEG2-like n=1 Tax=Contarinia nasturtii TaxID=265458 RepID=UPI0012D3FC40|nr:eisosome protein SEG2-like [Contarinia nasturtii]
MVKTVPTRNTKRVAQISRAKKTNLPDGTGHKRLGMKIEIRRHSCKKKWVQSMVKFVNDSKRKVTLAVLNLIQEAEKWQEETFAKFDLIQERIVNNFSPPDISELERDDDYDDGDSDSDYVDDVIVVDDDDDEDDVIFMGEYVNDHIVKVELPQQQNNTLAPSLPTPFQADVKVKLPKPQKDLVCPSAPSTISSNGKPEVNKSSELLVELPSLPCLLQPDGEVQSQHQNRNRSMPSTSTANVASPQKIVSLSKASPLRADVADKSPQKPKNLIIPSVPELIFDKMSDSKAKNSTKKSMNFQPKVPSQIEKRQKVCTVPSFVPLRKKSSFLHSSIRALSKNDANESTDEQIPPSSEIKTPEAKIVDSCTQKGPIVETEQLSIFKQFEAARKLFFEIEKRKQEAAKLATATEQQADI